LPGVIIPKVICNVSGGTWNFTHSLRLTHSVNLKVVNGRKLS